MRPISGIGVAAVGVGSVMLWAGAKGISTLAIVQNLISGKPIATDVVNPLTVTPPEAPATVEVSGGSNQAIGQAAAINFGWSGAQWDALNKLWTRESSWNNKANNASSGAYGIPQALPYTKMPQMAWPESAGGKSDAATQIEWGLVYIRQRYGSPVMAWAHEQTNGWY